jgi:hypothetical protein
MASNVPLTIQTAGSLNLNGQIVIGQNQLTLDYMTSNCYWYVVIDRTNLNVVANFNTKDNSNVPSQLAPYQGNSQYIMILSTQGLGTMFLPQGALYNFLVSEGAGSQLNRAEQIFEALNCGYWGYLNYCFVTVLGQDTIGFENLDYSSALVSTFSLVPVTVGSGVLYTPTAL